MFTVADLQRAKQEKYGIQDTILFSVERDAFAYALSCENSTDRGDFAEWLVCDRLRGMGYSIQRLGGSRNSYDLILNKTIRAEVKLATLRRRNYYICEKIKPELFDVLLMMFLTPDGMIIRWSTSEDISDWASWHKRGKEGYSIYFNNHIENYNVRYNDFDSFQYYYHPRYMKYLTA